MAGRRGFTLFELLIVIGICGLFLILTFPVFNRFKQDLWLDSSARQRITEIRMIQVTAMARGEIQTTGRFKFSGSGFPLPGGTGTEVLINKLGRTRKIILSSAGRARIE